MILYLKRLIFNSQIDVEHHKLAETALLRVHVDSVAPVLYSEGDIVLDTVLGQFL